MPQVPVSNEQGITRQQAAPNARLNVQTSEASFGGGAAVEAVGRAGAGLAQQAFQIAKEERQKADDVATQEAYTKTVKLRNDLMYDPKNGAMNRKGKDAFGVGQEYGQQFNKGADQIESSLATDEQRAMYQKIRQQELRDLDGNLTRHTFQQAQEYDQETTISGIKTTQEDAVMNYQDPGKVDQALKIQNALIDSHGARAGQAPEVISQRKAEAASKTYEAVIQRMLANGQDLAASEYYNKIKGSIVGQDATQVETALQEGSLRGESQRQAGSIVSKHSNMTSALAEVDKIQDPKIQDATRERVKQRFAEREQAQQYAGEQAFRSAYSIVEKSRNKDDIPPGQWAAMSPAQKNSIESYLKSDKVETDWNEYYNLKQMAATPAMRDKFMKTDLLIYRAKLGDTEFKELVNAQGDARKGDNTQLDGFQSDQQIVNGALAEAGIDPSPKPASKDAKSVNLFRRRVDEEVRKRQLDTGKKVTNEEMQGIVDGLMVKGITNRGFIPWFDTEKRLFELERGTDKKFDFDVASVPATERQKIESALRAKGVTVNDDTVLALYRKKLSGMVGKRGP